LGGLYFLYIWYAGHRPASLYISAILFALALLVKVPTGVHYLPLVYIFYLRYRSEFMRKWQFWFYLILTAVPALLWYGHAIRISQQYYPFVMFGNVNEHGQGILLSNLAPLATLTFYWRILKRIIGLIVTPPGLPFFVLGIVIKLKTREEYLLYMWLISLTAYLLILATSNVVHQYYQLLLTPLCAVFMAKGFLSYSRGEVIKPKVRPLYKLVKWTTINRPRAVVLTTFVLMVLWTVLITPKYFNNARGNAWLEASKAVREISTQDTLVITSDGSRAITLYLSDRKGWPFPLGDLRNGAFDLEWSIPVFKNLVNQGGKYLVVVDSESGFRYEKEFVNYINSSHEKVIDHNGITVYKLKP